MKKVLKFLLILILVVGIAFVIISAIAPSTVTVERTTVINVPKDVVFDHMVHFADWDAWSPWAESDSTMKVDITGNDGQPGAVYHWIGSDKGTGEGKITNMSVEGSRMEYDMEFLKPWEGKSKGWLEAEETGDGKTTAKWGFSSTYGFFEKGFMMLMGMKGYLEKDFDKGLKLLKDHLEAGDHMASGNMDIKEVDFPGHTYVGKRKMIKWSDMDSYYKETFGMVSDKAGNKITGPASALFYQWDEKNMQADMAPVFPVSSADGISGVETFNIPAGKAYMIAYHGGYSGSAAAHEALGKHLDDNKKELSVVIEEYIVNDHTEKDSTKWITNIYYLQK